MQTSDSKTFERNAERIIKAWKKYAEDMAIDTNLWNSEIEMYQVMMEGFSPKRLRGIFTSAKGMQVIFRLGVYNGKYLVEKIKG